MVEAQSPHSLVLQEQMPWHIRVRHYTGFVYTHCRRFNSRDSDARDLMQDIFLRVFRMLGSFRCDNIPLPS